jgi:hypothetical protein
MILQEWRRKNSAATLTLYAFKIGFVTVVSALFFPEFFCILKCYNLKKKTTNNVIYDKITLPCNLLFINKEGDKYLVRILYF